MVDPSKIRTPVDLQVALKRLFEAFEGGYLPLATAAGTVPATVHGMVNGTSFPRWATLWPVLVACGVPDADLERWEQAHGRAGRPGMGIETGPSAEGVHRPIHSRGCACRKCHPGR